MSNQQTEMYFGTRFIESGNLSKIVKNPYHIREFETLNGIPDVVLVAGSKLGNIVDFEQRYSNILSSSGAARLLVVLDKRSYKNVESLTRATGLSGGYVKRILNNLEKIGAVQLNLNKGYRIAKGFELPSPRIVSIEFKLDNWQKALVQATRHSVFASRSFVIMPYSKHELLVQNRQHFMQFGISVGTFDTNDDKFRIIWRAPTSYSKRQPKSRVSYIDSLYRIFNSIDRLEATSAGSQSKLALHT